MKLIIDVPEENYKEMCEYGNERVDFDLKRMIQNGTPIPDNATNGDVIKAIFPSIEVSDSEMMKNVYTGIPYGELIGANIDCMRERWNSPYQKGGK